MIIHDRLGFDTVSRDKLTTALHTWFPDAHIKYIDLSASIDDALYALHVKPVEESGFRVAVMKDGDSIITDGLPDQNAKAAVAVRDTIDTDHRIVAAEPDTGEFVDLVPGMTPDQIDQGWRPIAELGW